jgi:uncharacterized protein YuzE
MRIRVDLKSDALYFRISEESIEESKELNNDFIVDYDTCGKIIGFEIFKVMKKYKLEDLTSFRVEIPDTVETTVCR